MGLLDDAERHLSSQTGGLSAEAEATARGLALVSSLASEFAAVAAEKRFPSDRLHRSLGPRGWVVPMIWQGEISGGNRGSLWAYAAVLPDGTWRWADKITKHPLLSREYTIYRRARDTPSGLHIVETLAYGAFRDRVASLLRAGAPAG